jgi:hypothetical protein
MKLNFRATLRSGRFIAAIAFAAFLTGNAGAAVVTTLAQDDAVVIPGDAATPSPAGDGAVTPQATPVPQNGNASPSDQPVVVNGGQAMGYPSSGCGCGQPAYQQSGCGCGQPAYQQSGCGCGSSNYMPMNSGAPMAPSYPSTPMTPSTPVVNFVTPGGGMDFAPTSAAAMMAPSESRRSRRPCCLQNLRSRPRCGGRCR